MRESKFLSSPEKDQLQQVKLQSDEAALELGKTFVSPKNYDKLETMSPKNLNKSMLINHTKSKYENKSLLNKKKHFA